MNWLELKNALILALKNHIPYSVIRLGDGEALTMQSVGVEIDSTFNHSWKKHVAYVPSDELKIEWKEKTAQAITNADCVGVHNGNHQYAFSGTWFRDNFKLKDTCKADIHLQLLEKEAYREIIESSEYLLTIGGHDLRNGFLATFDKDSDWIQIPLQTHYFKNQLNHFPDTWREVNAKIRKMHLAGTLVIVGGGIIGKCYCESVRCAGGVALDIGSVMDLWAGYVTRGKNKGGASTWTLEGL